MTTLQDITDKRAELDVLIDAHMYGMFQGSLNFDQDLSGWDVSNVTEHGSFGGGFSQGHTPIW